jgi:hypothetical protein
MTDAKRPFLLALIVGLASLLACKHTEATAAGSEAKAVAVGKSQCGNPEGFQGVCRVEELTGRNGTTTEAARRSAVGKVQQLLFSVPNAADRRQATVKFAGAGGTLDAWTIDQALDLYSRKGCLAQISGGIFGAAYKPVLTAKTLLNVDDDGATGFAEMSDFSGSTPVHATLRLACGWQ